MTALLTMASCILDCLRTETEMSPSEVAKQMLYSPIPEGELMKADFNIDHTERKKERKKKKKKKKRKKEKTKNPRSIVFSKFSHW